MYTPLVSLQSWNARFVLVMDGDRMKFLAERLTEAGRMFDGHVTNGSIGAQVKVVESFLAGILGQRDDLQKSLDLIHDADMRGIGMWQEAHPGNDHVWPDRGKMIFWLLGEIERMQRHEIRITSGEDGYPIDGWNNCAECGGGPEGSIPHDPNCVHMRPTRNEVLEEAYQIARGGEGRFEKHGTKQLYWKGRSDAATEIRKAKTK